MWLKLNNGEAPVTYNMDFVKTIEVHKDQYTDVYSLCVVYGTYDDEVLGTYTDENEAILQYERLLTVLRMGHENSRLIVSFTA